MPVTTADKRATFRKLHEKGCFVLPNRSMCDVRITYPTPWIYHSVLSILLEFR